MGLAQRVTTPMTVDEFRTWADRQPGRWELVDGQPRAMSPASSTHGFIQARAAYLVERHIEASGSPCRSATEPPVIPAAYKRHNARAPDLGVTCAPPSDDWELMRPVFLLEILSPTNERDTRDNVWAYMTIPSVRQILLVDSTAVRGEMLRRDDDGAWPEEPVLLGPDDAITIDAIGFSCPLRDLYARTHLVGPSTEWGIKQP
jgi:Uma2 family endonuclease